MTTRTHLSIGEVLSLLTDDFPDLTITKIRFLESQGLIDPERTASGYRKFYDFDIERLRWILRQQRENFLPLKVIKDRLDRSDGRLPDEDTAGPAQPALDLARDPGNADPPPVWMADHAKGPRDRSADASGDRDGSDGSAGTDRPATAAEPTGSVAPASPAPAGANPGKGKGKAAAPSSPPDPPGKKQKAQSTPPAKAKPEPKTGSGATTHGSGGESRPAKGTPPQVPAPRSETTMATATAPDSGSETEDLTDVSLTRAELLGASNLDDRQLTQLESFGIVVPVDGLDDPLYGSEALVCARQAAVFLELGMEPRHLRAFKVAADREAGLYEQLVLPLLRQRNPAARAEATRTVGRLTAAGAAIHAALLQQSLRSQLRPRR